MVICVRKCQKVLHPCFSFFSLQKTLSEISSFTAEGAELRRVTDETFALLDSLAGAAALEELVSQLSPLHGSEFI